MTDVADALAPWAAVVPGVGPVQDMRPSATLGSGDLLDGEDVVPGFSHPVRDIFDV